MPDFSIAYETDGFRVGFGEPAEAPAVPVAGEPAGIPTAWLLGGGALVIGIVLVLLLK
jgi:hypothetical protein